jgi:hypothetical protein
LKTYGITIYGFVDAWSRKILGMFAHVTNNDPKHIAVYFLRLSKEAGGIPLKLTTNLGTKTVDMAPYQIQLSQEYDGIPYEEARKRIVHTKLTCNQKIESLWSQMMKEHNKPVIDIIYRQEEGGKYNNNDPIQRCANLNQV